MEFYRKRNELLMLEEGGVLHKIAYNRIFVFIFHEEIHICMYLFPIKSRFFISNNVLNFSGVYLSLISDLFKNENFT